MTDPQKSVIETLAARVSRLQGLLDESAVNEIALIATLKELLPDFGPRFDKWRKDAKTVVAQRDHE
jgi:hypothetical protein